MEPWQQDAMDNLGAEILALARDAGLPGVPQAEYPRVEDGGQPSAVGRQPPAAARAVDPVDDPGLDLPDEHVAAAPRAAR